MANLSTWADRRETHDAVAAAIHALSHASRSPEEIWDDPTDAELEHVEAAVRAAVLAGEIPEEEDGHYPWGQFDIVISGGA